MAMIQRSIDPTFAEEARGRFAIEVEVDIGNLGSYLHACVERIDETGFFKNTRLQPL